MDALATVEQVENTLAGADGAKANNDAKAAAAIAAKQTTDDAVVAIIATRKDALSAFKTAVVEFVDAEIAER